MSGETMCCGEEDEVRAMLVDLSKKTANPLVNDILNLERQLRKEAKGGTRANTDINIRKNTPKRDTIRSRFVRGAKLEGRHARILAKRKRLSVH